MIAEKQQEILALEQALEKQQTIQEYMKLELAARGDLNRIEEFAKMIWVWIILTKSKFYL